MNAHFYEIVALAFAGVGGYRYLVHPNWNIKDFFRKDAKLFMKSGIITAVVAYFATDLASFMPDWMKATETMEKAPKLSAFAIGAIGGSIDLLEALKSVLSIHPVGAKMVMLFQRKEVKP